LSHCGKLTSYPHPFRTANSVNLAGKPPRARVGPYRTIPELVGVQLEFLSKLANTLSCRIVRSGRLRKRQGFGPAGTGRPVSVGLVIRSAVMVPRGIPCVSARAPRIQLAGTWSRRGSLARLVVGLVDRAVSGVSRDHPVPVWDVVSGAGVNARVSGVLPGRLRIAGLVVRLISRVMSRRRSHRFHPS
jgi:hypothetical protein